MDEGRQLNHSELLTIAAKDEQYFNTWIRDDVQEIAQKLLGLRTWIRFRDTIHTLSRLGYFSVTSLLGGVTPGEEYCEARLDDNGWKNHLLATLLNIDLRLPPDLERFAKLVKDIHLVTFYLFGDFYELSKRAANLTYRTYSPDQMQSRSRLSYKLLGCLTLIRMALTNSRAETTTSEKISGSLIVPKDSTTSCPLCSNQRSNPTSTLCGHIFCWDCIYRWLRERSECPICRTSIEPSRLVYLINFR